MKFGVYKNGKILIDENDFKCYNKSILITEVLHMADTCGDCRYYGESKCSNPRYDSDHKPCSDFKR